MPSVLTFSTQTYGVYWPHYSQFYGYASTCTHTNTYT